MSRKDDDGDDADETAATGESASLGHLGILFGSWTWTFWSFAWNKGRLSDDG